MESAPPTASTNRACSVCAPGTLRGEDDRVCRACRYSCPAGEYLATACLPSSDAECHPCAAGMYKDRAGPRACVNVTRCEEGAEFIVAPATVSTDTECAVSMCLPSPCQHDGVCRPRVNGYECVCMAPYGARDCATRMDVCDDNPCRNGGECIVHSSGFVCRCADPFMGDVCDVDPRSVDGPNSASASTSSGDDDDSTMTYVLPAMGAIIILLLVAMVWRHRRGARHSLPSGVVPTSAEYYVNPVYDMSTQEGGAGASEEAPYERLPGTPRRESVTSATDYDSLPGAQSPGSVATGTAYEEAFEADYFSVNELDSDI